MLTDDPQVEPANLSMRETLACVGDDGRIRCPSCGRFARLEEIRHTPSVRWAGGRASLLPACKRCRP